MRRLATFRWRTPEPTAVDEELAVYDDGSAWLVVRGSRTLDPLIGSYRCDVSSADRLALADAGPAPIEFDLLVPPVDEARAALAAVADRVATAARLSPEAVATFEVQSLGTAPGGSLRLSLLAVAAGVRPVEFELDPAASSIQLGVDGQGVTWSDLPDLPAGFVSPDALELGGVRRRARIEPGAYGAIALEVPPVDGATVVSARLAGWLAGGLPDDPLPQPFQLRAADAALPPVSTIDR